MNKTINFSMDKALDVAVDAARTAGQILRNMLKTAAVREKGPKDLVTDADLAAQAAIEAKLKSAFPDHAFLGEESNASENHFSSQATSDQWQWVVDPLDGTANYVHGLPNFAVSIALMRGNDPYVGVVFDPMSDELYTAVHSNGAYLNGEPIHASSCCRIEQAMIAASFPPMVRRDSLEVAQFIEVLVRSQSIRRLGSAALNLCYVAQGRLDGYWAGFLKPWDIAAGALIAIEAGASISQLDGGPFNIWEGDLLVTSTQQLHQELHACLNHASV